MSGAYLNEIPVAATSGVAWSQTVGVQPYTSTLLVHKSQWGEVEGLLGEACTLRIVGLNGEIEVKDVYPLHEMPTTSPNRVAFLIADKRWKWPYKLHVRDYNVTRQTGDKIMLKEGQIPIELAQFVDRFKYMTYSLDREEKRFKARRVIEDVLTGLEGENGFDISSISLAANEGEEGQISIQNLLLRDRGDNAMSRALALIPGTQVTVDLDGTVRVFDGTDLELTEEIRESLGPISQHGEYPRLINRMHIRPKAVRVYTVREIEIRCDLNENYKGTVVPPNEDDPFIENVLPLPDVETVNIRLRDEERNLQVVDAPQGTWAPVSTALNKWEEIRQEEAVVAGLPYSFSPAIETFYPHGNLNGAWVGNGADLQFDQSDFISASSRVQAIEEHFRRTFRINPKYMARIREIKAVRAGLLNPITGARAPAAAWMNYCVIPTFKGRMRMALSEDPEVGNAFNVNTYPGIDEDLNLIASQHQVSIRDSKLGIFTVRHVTGPYGMQGSALPGYMVNSNTQKPTALRAALRYQNEHPIAPGCAVEGAAKAFLGAEFNLATVLTFIPNSPNDKSQMHMEEYTGDEIAREFAHVQGLAGGAGPVLEVFIPPSVCTARFAWQNTAQARDTIRDLMGTLGAEDDVGLSPERAEMPGFLFVNGDDEIPANSKAVAAESLMNYADTIGGSVQTAPRSDLKPDGAISGVSHVLSTGGKVATATGFRGRQISIDRFALLPHPVRHITLGIIPYKADDR